MTDPSLTAIAEAITLQPWLTAAPASVVLQMVALARLRGALRAVSIILAVCTGAVCALALTAYAMDPGNLWQLFLMLAAPPMFVLTAGTLLMGMVVGPRHR